MDEMVFRSNLSKRVISKLLEMLIEKQFGYDVSIHTNKLEASVVNGDGHIRLDVDIDLPKDVLLNLAKKIGI